MVVVILYALGTQSQSRRRKPLNSFRGGLSPLVNPVSSAVPGRPAWRDRRGAPLGGFDPGLGRTHDGGSRLHRCCPGHFLQVAPPASHIGRISFRRRYHASTSTASSRDSGFTFSAEYDPLPLNHRGASGLGRVSPIRRASQLRTGLSRH